MIISTDKNYLRNDIEISKGEDFIVFCPYIFKVKSKDIIRDLDFPEKVQNKLGCKHCYFSMNSNIGYLIIN